MAVPISVGDVRLIIHDLLALYHKFKAAQRQITTAAKDLQSLDCYLNALDLFLQKNDHLPSQIPNEVKQLVRTLHNIRNTTREIRSIFELWNRVTSFPARAKWTLLGGHPERLRVLTSQIVGSRKELQDWMLLLIAQGVWRDDSLTSCLFTGEASLCESPDDDGLSDLPSPTSFASEKMDQEPPMRHLSRRHTLPQSGSRVLPSADLLSASHFPLRKSPRGPSRIPNGTSSPHSPIDTAPAQNSHSSPHSLLIGCIYLVSFVYLFFHTKSEFTGLSRKDV